MHANPQAPSPNPKRQKKLCCLASTHSAGKQLTHTALTSMQKFLAVCAFALLACAVNVNASCSHNDDCVACTHQTDWSGDRCKYCHASSGGFCTAEMGRQCVHSDGSDGFRYRASDCPTGIFGGTANQNTNDCRYHSDGGESTHTRSRTHTTMLLRQCLLWLRALKMIVAVGRMRRTALLPYRHRL